MSTYEKRQKLDEKATKATFVGYDEVSKGFRITDRDRETRKITISRGVVFFDTMTAAEIKEGVCKPDNELLTPKEEELPTDENEDEQESGDDDEFFDAEEQAVNEPRRSARSNIGQTPARFGDCVLYSATEVDSFEPSTY